MSREPREFWIVESADGNTHDICKSQAFAEAVREVNDNRYASLAPWKVIPCVEIVK